VSRGVAAAASRRPTPAARDAPCDAPAGASLSTSSTLRGNRPPQATPRGHSRIRRSMRTPLSPSSSPHAPHSSLQLLRLRRTAVSSVEEGPAEGVGPAETTLWEMASEIPTVCAWRARHLACGCALGACWCKTRQVTTSILYTEVLTPSPSLLGSHVYVTGAIHAPLDAPYGPSETVPVLRDPWRW
jgi:hypothetical protein